ncbi:glycosyltransferase [Winogradskyella poriferorum]|uniref:glycosyltransferase n=1 Tax=Winogradskyella poriferorum TaxID=307627 RepID=UPI003D6517FB
MGKRIVHVVNDFPSKSETFIVNHIVETIKNGYEVSILVNNLHPQSHTSQQLLFDEYGLYKIARTFNPSLPKNKIVRLVKAKFEWLKKPFFLKVFLRTLNKKYGKKSRSLKMWFQTSTFLEYRDVQLFHAHFGVSGKILAEMKEIGAIKGDIFTTFYGIDTFSTNENRAAIKKYYSDLFSSAKSIITSSSYLANNLKLLEIPIEKLHVNSVGVDLEKFKYQKRKIDSQIRLVTVGRLIKLKGQDLGIRAVKLLVDKGYKINYSIVGKGEEYINLKNLITELKLEYFVDLKKGNSQQDVIEMLYDSHLFLMTSTKDKMGRAEGQGLVSAEAQATGIPVIGFRCGGVPETIQNGKTGVIIDEINEYSLAIAIKKFIKKPSLINEMGLSARAMVENDFDNHIQSKKIIELYNSI